MCLIFQPLFDDPFGAVVPPSESSGNPIDFLRPRNDSVCIMELALQRPLFRTMIGRLHCMYTGSRAVNNRHRF